MSAKPVILRERAHLDVDKAVEGYVTDASAGTALAFIDALEGAFRHLGEHPATGSSRYGSELDLIDLRSWNVRRFPYVVFYVESEMRVEVWRVLHTARDIPALLSEPTRAKYHSKE